MNTFSISDLENFSGIKAHTIRVWEKRYNALKPDRSDGNTRYYDNTQLRRLLNIVSLMNVDYKISKLCPMPDEEIFKLLEKQLKNSIPVKDPYEHFISQMIAAGMSYDELYFEKIFSNCILRFGLKETYALVIYPMLIRLGLMWANDTLPAAQEHFISNIIRQKLFTAIDSLPPVTSSQDSWILFLPENEFHEIGLLFTHYIIRLNGKKVIYLGANIPIESLKAAVADTNTSHLFFFLVHSNMPAEAQKYLDLLTKNFKKNKIHLSGNHKLISQLKIKQGMQWIQSIEQLEKELLNNKNV